MVKAIGGCLIVYASFMVGHAIGQLHGRMVKEMEEMLLFIQLFKGQIMYAGSELPEILADSAKRLKGNVGKWVSGLAEMSEKNRDRPFAELWTDSLVMLRRDSALSLEVLADVDRLGKIMGDMDVEAQLSRINLVEDIITDRYQRERARSSGIKRLANSLGLLGGVFIVILLM